MIMLTLTAWLPGLTPPSDRYPTAFQNAALYTSLYIVALGTGGIKPNVSAFGADQFDDSDPRDRREKTSFFNWFYFSINIGSLLAVTGEGAKGEGGALGCFPRPHRVWVGGGGGGWRCD
jgi:dipeptide/tripeptide permease